MKDTLCILCGKNKATICIEHDIIGDRRRKPLWQHKKSYICSECDKDWEARLREVVGSKSDR